MSQTTEIVFPGRVPGNNGKDGLLRMHWRRRSNLAKNYIWLVKESTRNKHPGPVRIELTRHSTGPPMDRDNLVSTGKLLIDSLVKAGVIPDDSPTVIAQQDYQQTRALKPQLQMTVLRIIDLPQTQS